MLDVGLDLSGDGLGLGDGDLGVEVSVQVDCEASSGPNGPPLLLASSGGSVVSQGRLPSAGRACSILGGADLRPLAPQGVAGVRLCVAAAQECQPGWSQRFVLGVVYAKTHAKPVTASVVAGFGVLRLRRASAPGTSVSLLGSCHVCGSGGGDVRPANLTQAFYQGAWLPCRVLNEDSEAGKIEVRVVDRTGTHDVWLVAEHVRDRSRTPPNSGPHATDPQVG